ncbi:cyclic nucleotide-binding domain-containing protein [Solidesulfovibrio alcoholivorans]|uniref:cyclic nucleotide-binding domain-containing protein n=1 Tax=Solidesulfovibrio alcoholivorans TaxID=81406 RepID=UPI000495154A|nr:cyclic nucleotide-binding domain-containing protein [Solidesulfovibrio alcoholivorans]
MGEASWARAELFAGLSPGELDAVRPFFDTVALPAGRDVIVEGTPGDDMFLLVSGKVRVRKAMVQKGIAVPALEAEAGGKTLADLSDAQSPFFGEMALLDRDIRSASVTCLTDCRFLRIDRDRFFAFLAERPEIGVKLVTALAKRLARVVRKNNNEIVKLTTALALVLSRRGQGRG